MANRIVQRRLGDLVPVHQPGMNPLTERRLRGLSDEELLRTASHPRDTQMIKVAPGGNRTLDGNTRVIELQRRMLDPQSKITPDTMLPVLEIDLYVPP